MATSAPSDTEDRILLRSHGMDEREIVELIRFKRNDPSSWCLGQIPIHAGENGNVRAAKRVGQIIGQAKRLTMLMLTVADRPALAEFCAELQSNRSIRSLSLDLENPGVDVSLFVPFLRENAAVTTLLLHHCSLQSAAELSNVVCSLEALHISNSPLSDVELNQRLALRNLTHLSLDNCGIGKRACASLTSLLDDPQSKLLVLSLKNNSIGDEAVSRLVDSLANKVDSLAGNTKLKEMNLVGNNEISKVGWSMLLKLVCNSNDVAKSNHCLRNLGIFDNSADAAADRERGRPVASDATTAAVIDALGANDAHLLRASLEINREGRWWGGKHAAIKRKMVWRHARGDLNIVCGISPVDVRVLPLRKHAAAQRKKILCHAARGDLDIVCDSPIEGSLLPRIMAWFTGVVSNEANASLIQYHDPPLPNAELGPIRLGSLYRLVRERPEVFEAVAVAVAMAGTTDAAATEVAPVANEAMLSADVEAEVDNGGVTGGEMKDGKRRGVRDGERRLTMSNKKQRVDPPNLSKIDTPLEDRMEESDGSVATEEPAEPDSNQFALLHAACGFYGRVPGVIYARATNSGGPEDDAGDAVNL